MAGLFDDVKSRAQAQASATLETQRAIVRVVYADGDNIVAADVVLLQDHETLRKVPNVSGSRIAVNTMVSVNFVRGNRNSPQITSAGGTDSAQAQVLSADSTPLGASQNAVDPSTLPLFLSVGDELCADGLVLLPGSGVVFRPGSDPDSGQAATFIDASAATNITGTLPITIDTGTPGQTDIAVDTATNLALGVVRGGGSGNCVIGSDGAVVAPYPPQASSAGLGLVRGGGAGNVSINGDGSMSAPAPTASPSQATNSALGLVRGGGAGNVSINSDGSMSAPTSSGGGSSSSPIGFVASGTTASLLTSGVFLCSSVSTGTGTTTQLYLPLITSAMNTADWMFWFRNLNGGSVTIHVNTSNTNRIQDGSGALTITKTLGSNDSLVLVPRFGYDDASYAGIWYTINIG